MSSVSLTSLRRDFEFFRTRGAAHTLTYGRWRLARTLQRSARSFQVDAADLRASTKMENPNLAAHLRNRVTPVFFFDEHDVEGIVARIPAERKEQTIFAADQVCKNTFSFRGAGAIRFESRIDWTACPDGNLDWRWDLNRHTFFESLGRAYHYTNDERYAAKFRELVCDWLARNPARSDQPNWSSVFEVAFRINMWAWALYYFRLSSVFDAEFVQQFAGGMLAHGRFLNANIELHVPNNHLLLEAKALALIGILFPEFQEAGQWRDRGLKLLEREVREQVCSDGVHGERTTLYHRVIAGELLELLVLMRRNRIQASPDLSERFAKMVEFEIALAKPDGTFPLLGDSAVADTHFRFSASSGGAAFLGRGGLPFQESDYWLLGQEPETPSRTNEEYSNSVAFPDGGYYLMKHSMQRDARYMILDCGPFGLPAMPNHGHADALSFELFALGETLLLDPGYYSTSLGLDWRNFFRGTRAHNTVVVDGVDQSQLLDERRVYHPARATCLQWTTNDEFDFVDGVHDGYERLTEPVSHRRQVLFAKPDYWVVVDTLTGRGSHRFDLCFHAMPGAQVLSEQGVPFVRIEDQAGAGLAIVSPDELEAHVATGVIDPIQGWVSFLSGAKTPAPALSFTRKAQTPVQFSTVLYPYRLGEIPEINVERISIDGRAADDPSLTALRIELPTRLDRLVIDRAGDKASVKFTSERK